MLSDEQIKQKWKECTRSPRRGDVISSVDMATELARWVEQQALEQALRKLEKAKAALKHYADRLNWIDWIDTPSDDDKSTKVYVGVHNGYEVAETALKELDDA